MMWCSSISQSFPLVVIRHARERGVPLVGTRGGFQHIVVEHVRNVLEFRDAEHEQTSPTAQRLADVALSCSLVGREHEVRLPEGSLAHCWNDTDGAVENYHCNFDEESDVRMVGRRDHLSSTGLRFSHRSPCPSR